MPSKFNVTHFAIIKLLRLFSSYFSIYLASNYMSQIYTEAVLVNDEDPPKLMNLVITFLMIDVVINAIIIFVLILLQKEMNINADEFTIAVFDYFMTIISFLVLLYFVASTMYNKKYFLYKDDGLRAIRALSSIMYRFALVINIIPYGLMIKNSEDFLGAFNQTTPTTSTTSTTTTTTQPSIAAKKP